MRRSSLPTSLTTLACVLPCQFANAEPQLQAWLDQRPVPLQWSNPAPQRYSVELELKAGELRLQAPNASGSAQPLALYRRQDWHAGSSLSLQISAPGRYRLMFQEDAQPHLRLLPLRENAPRSVCRAWQGEALSVAVGQVFADGEVLRDAYSGQLATVENGRVELTPAAHSDGLLLLEPAEASTEVKNDWRNATVYFVITDRFANGDTSNDRSYGRQPDGEQEIGTFHGGDLRGLTGKLDYLQQL